MLTKLKSGCIVLPSLSLTENCLKFNLYFIRALFEIALRRNWPLLAGRILKFAKTIERQMWDFETPLKQHPSVR